MKPKKRPKLLRLLYLLLGSLMLGLGVIGIILPILPTVPFFLLTAYFYAKGSERFHVWFIHSKLYRRYISGLAEHQTMSITGAIFLLILVSAMLSSALLIFPDSLMLLIILPTVDLIKYLYFIFRIKIVSRAELLHLKRHYAEKTLPMNMEEK